MGSVTRQRAVCSPNGGWRPPLSCRSGAPATLSPAPGLFFPGQELQEAGTTWERCPLMPWSQNWLQKAPEAQVSKGLPSLSRTQAEAPESAGGPRCRGDAPTHAREKRKQKPRDHTCPQAQEALWLVWSDRLGAVPTFTTPGSLLTASGHPSRQTLSDSDLGSRPQRGRVTGSPPVPGCPGRCGLGALPGQEEPGGNGIAHPPPQTSTTPASLRVQATLLLRPQPPSPCGSNSTAELPGASSHHELRACQRQPPPGPPGR